MNRIITKTGTIITIAEDADKSGVWFTLSTGDGCADFSAFLTEGEAVRAVCMINALVAEQGEAAE